MTLSDERLAQIEQRHHEFTTFSGEAGAKWGDHEERLYTLARDDVPALVAEVRRLRAELEKAEMSNSGSWLDGG